MVTGDDHERAPHVVIDPRAEPFQSAASQRAEALYIESGDRTLFGWLHRPAADVTAPVGLVICKPFGYEAICSHRSVRAFAEAAATLGVPALRFDYAGTGDSGYLEPEADQIEVWLRDVAVAVSELQRRTGVARVCLLGIRLGALLAMLAAERCETVAGAVLIAPVTDGRRYVRELRMTRLAGMLGAEETNQGDGAPGNAPTTTDGSMEVSGFSLSGATLTALARLDLSARSALPVLELLVIDGNSRATSRGWVDTLLERGARTTYLALPGLIEMTATAPQFATIPTDMIAAMCDWLPRFGPASAQTPARSIAPSSVMMLRRAEALPLEAISEEPVTFGSDGALFGIVTAPHEGEMRRRAVILLNAGADYHVGASGMYVRLARLWAERGYFVLRMDLGGLGDSETRPGRPENEVFPSEAIEDISAAINLMQNRHAVTDVTLAGLCSGAYHALHAAIAVLPVKRILMINPQNFFWKSGSSVTGMQVAELVRNPAVYRNRMFAWATWRRLLLGQVNVRYIAKILGNRFMLALSATSRDAARILKIRLPGDLAWELERIGARGVRMVFIFARGEPGIDLLRIQGGSAIKRLSTQCRVHIIDSGDHVFSKSGPRALLENVLCEELIKRSPGIPSHEA